MSVKEDIDNVMNEIQDLKNAINIYEQNRQFRKEQAKKWQEQNNVSNEEIQKFIDIVFGEYEYESEPEDDIINDTKGISLETFVGKGDSGYVVRLDVSTNPTILEPYHIQNLIEKLLDDDWFTVIDGALSNYGYVVKKEDDTE